LLAQYSLEHRKGKRKKNLVTRETRYVAKKKRTKMSTAECLLAVTPPTTEGGSDPEELAMEAEVDLECNARPATGAATQPTTQPMLITSPQSPKSHHHRGKRKPYRKKHVGGK